MRDSEHKVVDWIIMLSSAAVIAAAFVFMAATLIDGPILFTWRWFAIPIICSLAIVIMLVVLLIQRVVIKRGAFYWFMLLLICNVGFLLTFLMAVLSNTPQTEVFFQGILQTTWIPIPLCLLLFSASYISKRDLPLRPHVLVFLLAAFAFTMYAVGASPLASNHTPAQVVLTPWGYTDPPISSSVILYAWGGALSTASFIMLVRAYRREANALARKQLIVFIVALAQYFGIAAVVDIVLRTIFPGDFPPLSFIYTTLLSLIIGYGVYRYGLFQISPAALSDQILHNLSEAVIGVNVDYTIEFANAGSRSVLHRQSDSLEGRPVQTVLGDTLFQEVQTKLATSHSKVVIEDMIIHANGEEKHIVVTVSKIYGDGHHLAGYICVFQDVTELKRKTIALAHERDSVERKVAERTRQLHEERARLKASIESLALGFALVGNDGKVIMQNHILGNILQLDHAAKTVKNLGVKMQGFALAEQCQSVQNATGTKILKEISYGEKVLRVFLTGVTDSEQADHPIGAVLVVEDITEAKVLERSRDEFFSIASHELRTPLTAIRGNASMMLEYYPKSIDEEQMRQSIEDIHDSSVRLIEIVNDFLDTSRLEQKRMRFEYTEFPISKVIEGVIYEMKASIREKGIRIAFDGMTLDSLPPVWADKNRVKQVVYNLVGNAVKFTDTGTITITTMVEGEKLKVYISDPGRGIPIDSRRLLFHKFQQAGESLLTRDTTRGTGLGLYISKLIIENMGGEIALERSEEGRGSTFSFTVPLASSHTQPEQDHLVPAAKE